MESSKERDATLPDPAGDQHNPPAQLGPHGAVTAMAHPFLGYSPQGGMAKFQSPGGSNPPV